MAFGAENAKEFQYSYKLEESVRAFKSVQFGIVFECVLWVTRWNFELSIAGRSDCFCLMLQDYQKPLMNQHQGDIRMR